MATRLSPVLQTCLANVDRMLPNVHAAPLPKTRMTTDADSSPSRAPAGCFPPFRGRWKGTALAPAQR
ncbi:hypothetical protein SKAU_G00407980 [Synaphobranchus kaupii]|uniref:Uncharacterized protein n=1 Tax=Synaphobranchus kaupii TaxID=118154 RepID=A0A9Q1ID05_SYNKA|nr:hypothetical protein SKAU_G00407980 [Synaphobranchus kaupii]